MADYGKQTVAQLRQLLKDRGIPSTGLTRKAQIVEKLEEKDAEGEDVQDAPEPVAQGEEDDAQDVDEEPDAPAPALEEAGGVSMSNDTSRRKADATADPPAQPDQSDPPPVPTATLDGNRENVSHIDSDVPPPDQIKATEQSAEDTTADNEPGSIQPAEVFNAAPADPEDVVEPHVTEPADPEVDGDEKEELAEDELPDAPGPAAEALRLKQHDRETTMEDSSATPVANEEPSVEKADLLPIPERSTAETSRLPTEELEADSKKRKRRSGSPDLPLQEIKAKKPRPSQEPAPEARLKEDGDVVMEQRRPEDATPTQELSEVENRPMKKEKADRYKTLVNPATDDTTPDALQDDRPVAPALHPATPALYIRNFMRPLRPEPLRAHLVTLASPPSSSPDASIIKSLFLDALKTHALVLFTSTAAASRVRASLHGSIWPPEGNRKELWVDFVPEESVEDWITQEEDALAAEKEARASGRPIPAKRFEVVYPGDDKAVFQEVGTGNTAPVDAPTGPRASISQPTPSAADISASFTTLDKLFHSTSSVKPNLYFLPVPEDVSEQRLAEFAKETSRDWQPGELRKGRGLKTEMKYKYSFDNEGRLVEVGEDRGPWAEDLRDRGGRGRGGFRGDWRGRGDFGGRGRGGGIGWRGGDRL
ncbi:hypothetical protein HBH92_183290 [Parastagonospora nodorum]|nr:hypothetical protein HBI06_193170 [Parastagonospora nodorum]KAH4235389.1 hypothetical protein HBI05_147450 [Parastagonospora nodorum]KAH4405400.1 hypothetical protein HBH92_183290 [Parastagonospora nodorum]KAH4426600.1 hypothetical protein HBH93_173030 [Parastagonospora nodorum]KAH4436886.1 hypothetical protein HBH91_192780 [Parastagonospora nodorum]